MNANDFLNDLHFHDDTKGVFELRVKSETGAMKERKFTSNPEVIETIVKEHTKKKSDRTAVYYGVCKRYPRSKAGTKADIASIPALWADVDTTKMGWPTKDVVNFLYRLPYPLCPTMCVFTGGGLHLYWHLDEPIVLPQDDPELRMELVRSFEAVNKLIQQVMTSDMVWDISRVLRLPGTWNTKARDQDGEITNATKYGEKVEVQWSHWFATATLQEYYDAFSEVRESGLVLGPDGWGDPEMVADYVSSAGEVIDEKRAIEIAHRQEKRNMPAGWEEIWSRARYHANRWPYIGFDEATMRATAYLWCRGGATEDQVVDAVLTKLELLKDDQAPDEYWDWDAEEAKVRKKLDAWIEKWAVLKKQLDKAKREERKRLKALENAE